MSHSQAGKYVLFLLLLHPIVVHDFFESTGHKLLKFLVVSLLITRLPINAIYKLIDHPHYKVIIITIISIFKLNSRIMKVIVGKCLYVIYLVNNLLKPFVDVATVS